MYPNDNDRTAPADVQASFQEAVKKSAVPAQALGDNVDVKKLPGVEALLVDGAHYATLTRSRSALSD